MGWQIGRKWHPLPPQAHLIAESSKHWLRWERFFSAKLICTETGSLWASVPATCWLCWGSSRHLAKQWNWRVSLKYTFSFSPPLCCFLYTQKLYHCLSSACFCTPSFCHWSLCPSATFPGWGEWWWSRRSSSFGMHCCLCQLRQEWTPA